MAEWPVRTEDFEPRPYEREPILAGTELVLMRSRGQGRELVGYHFQCPCCGWLYYVPIEGTTVDQDPEWKATEEEGRLTLDPSLCCINRAGHYFLIDGVLREV